MRTKKHFICHSILQSFIDKPILLTIALFTYTLTYSQGVGINNDGSMPVAGAMLDVKSNTSGLLIPRMTEAQRDAINPDTQSMLIYQTDNDSGFYYYDGSGWNPFLIGGNAANSGWTTKGNTGTTPTTNFIGTIDSVDWVIRTDSTEQVRVMSNGNVGIGTSSPNQLLHLFKNSNGPSAIRAENINSGTSAWTGISLNNDLGVIGSLWSGSNNYNVADHRSRMILDASSFADGISFISRKSSGDIRFYTDGVGNERVRIDSTGNVGIGTTSPLHQIDATNVGEIRAGKFYAFSTTHGMETASNSLVLFSKNPSAGASMQFHVVADTAIYIKGNNAFVGIGTTAPEYELDVDGTTITEILRVEDPSDGNNNRLILNAESGQGVVKAQNSIHMILDTDNNNADTREFTVMKNASDFASATELFRVEENGNVGIGTTAPLSILEADAGSPGAGNSRSVITWTAGGGSGVLGIKKASSGRDRQYIVFNNTSSSTALFLGNDGNMRHAGIANISTNGGADGGTIIGTETSDERLKENMVEIPYGLKEVMLLKPIHYYYKVAQKEELGFGAQTTHKIIPEVVYDTKEIIDNSGKTKLAMEYSRLVPELTKAIQEQQQIIETLRVEKANQSELDNLKAENKRLYSEIEEIKRILNQSSKR